ncbi:MAG: hypothetical protein V1750_01195 [Acidobacteriota bacterium]
MGPDSSMQPAADAPASWTLRLRRPFGLVVPVSLLLLAGSLLLAEALLRWRHFAFLPPASIGSGHPQVDIKLERLDRLTAREGPVDCLFLGSSLVNLGIDPETFADAYRSRTGRPVRGFNFGLKGVTEPTAARLAELLVEKYRPATLVYGLTMANLTDEAGPAAEKRLLGNPWVRYRLGEWSLDGWLTDHSAAFRAFLGVRNLLDPAPQRQKWQRQPLFSAYGWGRSGQVWIKTLPDPLHPERFADPVIRRLAGYKLSDRHLRALDDMMRLGDRVNLLLVEMPLHPSVLTFRASWLSERAAGLAAVGRRAAAAGAPFLQLDGAPPIPPEAWHDRYHLNQTGAVLFSRWLAERTGQAVAAGAMADPTRRKR